MSADQIIAELPFEFVRKMRNWASSNLDGGLYATSKAFADIQIRSGFDETRVPVIKGEAEDVDRCLMTLENVYRQAVMRFWERECSMRSLGRRLHVEHHTARKRLGEGHRRLQAALHKRTAAWHQYRAQAAMAGAGS